MNKENIIRQMYTYAPELSHECREKALNAAVKAIQDFLRIGEPVTITNLGAFKLYKTKPRPSRNPRTGETFEMPAVTKIKFKMSPTLAHALNPHSPAAKRKRKKRGRK